VSRWQTVIVPHTGEMKQQEH